MARFFLPPLLGHGAAAERAYDKLRDEAEACTGAVAKTRRIESVECRRSGRDRVLQVGERDADTGRLVAAIIQLGRGTYTVHHVGAGPGDSPEPVVLEQSDVYSITDFQ